MEEAAAAEEAEDDEDVAGTGEEQVMTDQEAKQAVEQEEAEEEARQDPYDVDEQDDGNLVELQDMQVEQDHEEAEEEQQQEEPPQEELGEEGGESTPLDETMAEEQAEAQEGEEMAAGKEASDVPEPMQTEAEGEGRKAADAEPRQEDEEGAKEDGRPKVESKVLWHMPSATPNLVTPADGQLLSSLQDCGLHYLYAGARATVGMKAGRYMFEVKLMELVQNANSWNGPAVATVVMRVGLSLEGSSVLLGSSADSVAFDMMAQFWRGTEKVKSGASFQRSNVISIVVNLDAASPNANTVSLFKEGQRVGNPMALPEHMVGKTLFPTVTFKGATLRVNFGPACWKPLPFTCTMLQAAACEDVDVLPPTSGVPEVVLPIALPGTGLYDWADQFLKQNPNHVEISGRMLADWAEKSGLRPPHTSWSSMDEPVPINLGVPKIEGLMFRSLLKELCAVHGRSVLVLELRSNLLLENRKETLAIFPETLHKRLGIVLVGEQSTEHREALLEQLLEDKKARLLAEKKDSAELETLELTEEEKRQKCLKRELPDLLDVTINECITKISLPGEGEGFTELRYPWSSKEAATEHFRVYIKKFRMTYRLDVGPGPGFMQRFVIWQKMVQDWRSKLQQWQDDQDEKKEEADAVKEEEGVKADAKNDATAKDEDEALKALKKEDGGGQDEEEVPVAEVTDINDIGNGEPLYAKFEFEDWMLVSLRYELHLLIHSFIKDVDDADIQSMPEEHIVFYYQKYFKKPLHIKHYGANSFAEVASLMEDTIRIQDEDKQVEAVLREDTNPTELVKLTEEARRERQRSIDAGDETAALHFVKLGAFMQPAPKATAAAPKDWILPQQNPQQLLQPNTQLPTGPLKRAAPNGGADAAATSQEPPAKVPKLVPVVPPKAPLQTQPFTQANPAAPVVPLAFASLKPGPQQEAKASIIKAPALATAASAAASTRWGAAAGGPLPLKVGPQVIAQESLDGLGASVSKASPKLAYSRTGLPSKGQQLKGSQPGKGGGRGKASVPPRGSNSTGKGGPSPQQAVPPRRPMQNSREIPEPRVNHRRRSLSPSLQRGSKPARRDRSRSMQRQPPARTGRPASRPVGAPVGAPQQATSSSRRPQEQRSSRSGPAGRDILSGSNAVPVARVAGRAPDRGGPRSAVGSRPPAGASDTRRRERPDAEDPRRGDPRAPPPVRDASGASDWHRQGPRQPPVGMPGQAPGGWLGR